MEPTFIAGASYEATTSLRVHASATSKIRVPSLDQLYNPASGNPDLRPERANGVEVGVDQQLGGASTIGVSAFATHAHDFIERIGSTPFENQDQYQFTGVEVTGRTGVIARVTLDGAYSFLDAVNATPGAANARLQTRPRHRGTLQWEWKPLPASAVRGAAQYVGRQLYDARGSNPIQVPASPYALLDLGFTQVLARRYEVAFDVTNVFDHLYDQAYGLPREGRTALLTLRVRMD
jgi:outer membrane cobalamin receptor